MALCERVWLNVGGQRFWTTWSTLRRPPCSRLSRLNTSDPEYDPHANEFCFDRSSVLFDYILDVHRTGTLHIPHNVCVPKVLEEIQFWEIPFEKVACCCWPRIREYNSFMDRVCTLRKSLDKMSPGEKPTSNGHMDSKHKDSRENNHVNTLKRLRSECATLIDNPFSSSAAQVTFNVTR